ncbi:MAG TPA: hypothetical protein VMX15_01910, partial [Candidatus Heimdallarchaeota archaeon]|nr:hypothetical protein [Candidatus Heimdallarchaeota archaeon]
MRALVGCLTGLLLISALALGNGCLTWPATAEWVQLDTDPNDCNTVRAHRDVLTGYFAFKSGYLYLRLRTVASPGWPGVLANDQARFKWFIDTNGSNILKQGQIINNAEFLLMTEDRSPLDRLGEVTLMDDLNHIGFTARWNAMNAGAYFTNAPAGVPSPSTHWRREIGAGTAGTGGPQSACGAEIIGYRIEDATTGGFYVDMYVKLSHLPGDPLQVFWVSDNLDPNLNQAPTCDTADH